MTTITITPFAIVGGEELPDIRGRFEFVKMGPMVYDPFHREPLEQYRFRVPYSVINPDERQSFAPVTRHHNKYMVEMVAEKLKQDFIKQFS